MEVNAHGILLVLLRRCDGERNDEVMSQRRIVPQWLLQLVQPGRADHRVSQLGIDHAKIERQPRIDRHGQWPLRLAGRLGLVEADNEHEYLQVWLSPRSAAASAR